MGQVFQKLKNKTDHKQEEDDLNTRNFTQHQRSQERLAELIDDNTSLPVTISSVRILHANRTRRSFLEHVVNPILSANREEQFTLEEALKEVGKATDKLNRFGNEASAWRQWPPV